MGGGASVKNDEDVFVVNDPQTMSSPTISAQESSRPQKIKLANLEIPPTTPRNRRRLSSQGKNLLWESLSPSPTRKSSQCVDPPPSPISTHSKRRTPINAHSRRRSVTKPPPSPLPSEDKKRRSSNVTKRFGRVESPPRVHKSYFGTQLRQNLVKRFRENKSPRKNSSTWDEFNEGDFVDVRVKKGDNLHQDNDTWDLAEIISVSPQMMTVRTERSGKTMWLDADIDRANVAVAFSKSSVRSEQDIDPFKDAMKSMGFRVRHVSADGNCLFRSIAFLVWGDESHHDYLRRLVCEHMLSHRSHFGLYTDGSFDQWLENMRQDGCWGGELAIQASEEILDRPIQVFSSEDPSQPMNLIHNNVALAFHLKHVKPITLSYHGRSHYNALVPLAVVSEDNLECLGPRGSRDILNGRLKGWRTPKLKRKKRRMTVQKW